MYTSSIHICVIFNTNILGVTDISVTEKNKYVTQMSTICHMTIVFKLDLAIMKVNMHVKNKDAASWRSRFTV